MKIQYAHDKFFKATFSNLEVTRDFLKDYLPEPILNSVDLQKLEIQNGSYIDDKLKETRSDMLFKTTINQKEGYLYFLFEHKSYVDRTVGLQLLTYIVRIWNQKIENEEGSHIPVIIPIVIYHGKENWKIANSLESMIFDYDTLPEEVKQLTPNFRYQVYDLSKFSDEDIKLGSRYYVALSILKDVNQKQGQEFMETIFKVVRVLNELEEKDTALQYLETCMRYIFAAGPQLSKEQLNTIIKQIEQIYPKGSEITMSLAEVLRNEGIEEGFEKGRKSTLLDLATSRLVRKFGIMPAQYREKIAELDPKMLEVLNYEIDNFQKIEDVKKFLAL